MLNSKRDSLEFLFLLICGDIFFILLHLFHVFTPYFPDVNYSIATDGGFAEVFQYLKGYWIALIFCWICLIKSYPYLVWSSLFGFLVVDDAFRMHERFGRLIANYFDYRPMLMLRARDFGELTVFAISGVFFLAIMGAAYYWGSSDFKRTSKTLVMLLLLFVFFGVVVDMVHILLGGSSIIGILGTIVEDGGEMLVMSVICWYILQFLRQARGLT